MTIKPGRQKMKGHKCPTCKKYGLAPKHTYYGSTQMPVHDGFNFNDGTAINFYECRNCYAQFELDTMEEK